jgi:DUF3048 family protein
MQKWERIGQKWNSFLMLNRMRRLTFRQIATLDITVLFAVVGAGVVGLIFLVWLVHGSDIVVHNTKPNDRLVAATSALTGESCADPTRRPVAVMLASDEEARPLSGLSAAEMVFEMPVTPNGITRLMAIFQCGESVEVGSIRSARMDFIPLVQGLDAIYAHWGGEHEALERLNRGVVDNVDALKYEGTVFYRKRGIPRPHNGFTTISDLREKAEDLGYTASSSLTPYLHTNQPPERNLAALISEASIPWPQGFDVLFRYDPETNRYARWRNGKPEIDRLTERQVTTAVVMVLDTDASLNYGQYLTVYTIGEGTGVLYQNGRRTDIHWKKSAPDAMLSFTNPQGKPVALVPGPVWILFNPELP